MEDISISMTGSGTIGEIQEVTFSESVSPVNPANPEGATGQATIDAKTNRDTKFVIDNNIVINDVSLGTFYGTVQDVSIDGIDPALTVASNLSMLNIDVTAPATGSKTLSAIFSSYIALADGLTLDYIATSDPVRVYGGWSGNLWTHLKWLCAVNQVEMVYYAGSLRVRDIGVTQLDITDHSNLTVSLSSDSTGRYVDMVSQNTELVSTVGNTKFNYDTNPSLEAVATNWSLTSSGVTVTGGRTAARPYSGTYSFQGQVSSVTPGVAQYMRIEHTVDTSAIAVGSEYSVLLNVRFDWNKQVPSNTKTLNALMIIDRGESFPVSLLSSSFNRNQYSTGYTYFGDTYIKQQGEAALKFYVSFVSQGINELAVGDRINADAALVTNGQAVPYFDGNSPGASWLGTANNSVSSMVIGDQSDFYNALVADSVFTVNAGETVRNVVQTTHFPFTLSNPVVNPTPTQVKGSYFVSSSDNLPLPSGLWVANGGAVQVSLGTVPGSINIDITGPSMPIAGYPGPYYLGYYNGVERVPALSIVGTGVRTSPETIHVATGASEENTSNEIAATVNIPFISSLSDLYRSAPWAAVEASGPVQKLDISMGSHQISELGLTPGSLIWYDDAIYRITDCTIKGIVVNINARWFTRVADSDALWAGRSAMEFDSYWSGFDAQDFQIAPLRFYNTDGQNWLFPATNLFPSTSMYPGVQVSNYYI